LLPSISPLLSFDDAQLATIKQLAEPIHPPARRSIFLSMLVAELGPLPIVSGADIMRIGQELQRVFLRAGGDSGNNGDTTIRATQQTTTTRLQAERWFKQAVGG
jgi:hypothetical protein